MLESQLARSSEDQSEDHAGQKSRQISNITRPLKIALLA
ncbi:MAG: hypothetical protein ACI9FB_000245, partial [Candidatus Azotimanducaceae bacterium]